MSRVEIDVDLQVTVTIEIDEDEKNNADKIDTLIRKRLSYLDIKGGLSGDDGHVSYIKIEELR